MFFPVGWPRVLNSSEPSEINAVVCNRDKILFAVLTTDALTIWYCKARILGQNESFYHSISQTDSFFTEIIFTNIILITLYLMYLLRLKLLYTSILFVINNVFAIIAIIIIIIIYNFCQHWDQCVFKFNNSLLFFLHFLQLNFLYTVKLHIILIVNFLGVFVNVFLIIYKIHDLCYSPVYQLYLADDPQFPYESMARMFWYNGDRIQVCWLLQRQTVICYSTGSRTAVQRAGDFTNNEIHQSPV